MKPRRTERRRPEASPVREDAPALPVYKAFVVQFTRETCPRRGALSGRIEHLSSGRRARFVSTRELLAALRKMLAELGERTD